MKYDEFKEAFEGLCYELNRITETSAILANVARHHGVDNIDNDSGGDYTAALELVAENLRQSVEKHLALFGEISLHGITQEGA